MASACDWRSRDRSPRPRAGRSRTAAPLCRRSARERERPPPANGRGRRVPAPAGRGGRRRAAHGGRATPPRSPSSRAAASRSSCSCSGARSSRSRGSARRRGRRPARRCRRAARRRSLQQPLELLGPPAVILVAERHEVGGGRGHRERALEVAVEAEAAVIACEHEARVPLDLRSRLPRAPRPSASSLITQIQLPWVCSRIESSCRRSRSAGGL